MYRDGGNGEGVCEGGKGVEEGVGREGKDMRVCV